MPNEIITTVQIAENDRGDRKTAIDPVRAVRNARNDFGVAHAATALVTLATAAPGAVRGRVVAIGLYAAAATVYTFTDNAVAIFTTLRIAAIGHAFLGKNELGEGGIIFTTDFTIDPDANSSVAWVAWIPEFEYDE